MIVAYEMPAVSGVAVNQGALVSDSADDLHDGSPGTSVIFTTPASTGSTLRITLSLATSILPVSADFVLVKVANVRAESFANPPQVAVTLLGPGTAFSAAAVVLEPTGENSSRSILIPRSSFAPGFTAITGLRIDITNQTASSPVSIGDAFVSRAYEIPLEKLAEPPIDPSQTRRSEGNQPWPLFRLPFRRITANFAHVSYRDAFVDSTLWPTPGNLRNLMFGATRAEKVCICTRWRYDRDHAANQTMISGNTLLARLVEVAGFEGEAGKDRWPITAVFEESL